MTSPTVAGAILELAARNGVTRVFGLPGVHNLPFWDSPTGSSIVGVRHEQAAVYASDGLHRATGDLGMALLTSGPGAANAVAAFGEACASGSPVISVASDVSAALRAPSGRRGLLHEMADQSAMFAAFGVPARSSRTRQEAMTGAVLALRDARGAPATPSYLGVPSDVLSEAWTADIPHLPRLPAIRPDDHRVSELTEIVAASERPVLWLGGGVVASGAEDAARSLAHRLGAAVVTSFAGRGLLAGDPLLVGAPVHEPEVRDLLAGADFLLVLGSDLDGMNTMNWRLPLPPRRAAITLGAQIERTVDLDALIAADVGIALAALAEQLDAMGIERAPWQDSRGIGPAVGARLMSDDRTAPALSLVRAIDASWPPDGAVVCDMAVAGYWYGGYSTQPRTRRLQYPVGWGTLGYAVPAAIGPASVGIPTLAICGDGGPMLALGELATYAQHSLPITVLIVDDGGYGMLRFDQQVFGHEERGVDLVAPEWVTLGAAFGIEVERITSVGEVGGALERALEANRRGEPRMVVLPLRLFPPATTSPRWPPPLPS